MTVKKTDLDDATVMMASRLLAMPPMHHDELKLGRPKNKKRRENRPLAHAADVLFVALADIFVSAVQVAVRDAPHGRV